LNGCSAGGVSAALWSNYVRDKIPKAVKIYAILDAALLLDTINVRNNIFQFRLAI